MVMRAIGSFCYLVTRFISKGAAEGNKHGQGGMDTACIPKITILFYCTDTIHLCPFIYTC